MVAVAIADLPDRAREMRLRTLAKLAEMHARRGTVMPDQPTVSWRRVLSATRIPGNA